MAKTKHLKPATKPGDTYMEVLIDSQESSYIRNGLADAISKGYDTFVIGAAVTEGDQFLIQVPSGHKYRVTVTHDALTVERYAVRDPQPASPERSA